MRVIWNSIGMSRLTTYDREQIEHGNHPGDDGSGRDFKYAQDQLLLIEGDGNTINIGRLGTDEPPSDAEVARESAVAAAEAAKPRTLNVEEAVKAVDVNEYVRALESQLEHTARELHEANATIERVMSQRDDATKAAEESARTNALALAAITRERDELAAKLEEFSRTANLEPR